MASSRQIDKHERPETMKKIEKDSNYPLYFSFFVMLLMMLFVKNIHFEPIDFGFIKQIIHPEHPKGGLSYDPLYHYNYIVASLTEWLGYTDNFTELARIFWLLETALAILVLIRLCNFVFKNDKMILVITIMMFMLSISGETEQKTMARPLYFLAIYYFLQEKWLISAVFGASIFYLHPGLAMWWFLPSCFALAIKFIIHKKISLKQITNYLLVVTVLASPILYFYLGVADNSGVDEFLVKYLYYSCWYCSSVVLTLSSEPMTLINKFLMVAIFLMGYAKAKKSSHKNNNVISIAIGVFILYILNFIFADIFGNGTVIMLQFLRSILNIEIFSSLFLAFLFARQIKKGNYIFFFIYLLLSFYYTSLVRFFGGIDQVITLNVFYAVMLIYEIFEGHILDFMEGIYKASENKLNLYYLKRFASKGNQLLQRPIVIAVFLIFLIVPKLPMLKSHIKTTLDIPQYGNALLWTANKYLFNDIVRFTNEKITDENTVLLAPFREIDFDYYTNHNIFINYQTPIYLKNKYSQDFKYILEYDLHYSLEKLFNVEEFSPNNFINNWGEIWENLSEDTIIRWKERYNLTHVIREKELPLNFPVVYQNPFYVIYEIR